MVEESGFSPPHVSSSMSAPRVLVVCLCADWCGVCTDYRSRFETVAARFPGAKFLWMDVEDEADVLHPLDIDNFPTVLVAVGDEPRFLGPVAPHIETLDRLIRAQCEPSVVHKSPDVSQVLLLQRIRQAHSRT